MNKKPPKEILVYQMDEIDGEPVWAVVTDIEDIPEDAHGQKIGNYTLNNISTFRVRRSYF